jgi:hypothetical protein
MMRWMAWIAFLSALLPGAAMACPLSALYDLAHAPLDGMKPLDIDASADIETSEGAEWHAYREKDGRVHSIVLDAFGESGRNTYRLSIRNRTEYVIAETRIDYNAHAFLGGPVASVKETTDYYYFCDGTPFVPKSEMTFVGEDYVKSANKTRDLIFGAKSVNFYTKGLK